MSDDIKEIQDDDEPELVEMMANGPAPRNIRLLIAYDGTDFRGWQIQPNGPSIQAEILSAIRKMTGETVSLHGSGRTDAGVHAIGQVASFRTTSQIPVSRLGTGLNSLVPLPITILHAEEVPLRFHAQRHAVRKRYRYVIDNRSRALPLFARYCHHVNHRLNVDQMQAAANILIGTHDFHSFETRWPNRFSSVRTILQLKVERYAQWPVALPGTISDPAPHPEGDFICIDVTADGFLYNMVRSIVGTLYEVGRGAWSVADVAAVLEIADRRVAGMTFPAKGLFLMQVDYPDEATSQ